MKIVVKDKIPYLITFIIRAILIVVAFMAVYNQSWTNLFIIILTYVLTYLPYYFTKRYHIHLPVEFELLIIVFVFFSIFLGEVQQFYTFVPWWDIFVHALSSIGFGLIGFTILYIFDQGGKIKTSPRGIAIFAFCFALAIGTLWEIFEFGMDSFFGLNMQKSGLQDTMWDLIIDSLGALFTSIMGWVYLKYGRGSTLNKLITKFRKKNPDLFRTV